MIFCVLPEIPPLYMNKSNDKRENKNCASLFAAVPKKISKCFTPDKFIIYLKLKYIAFFMVEESGCTPADSCL